MKQSLYGKYPGVLKNDTKYIENCSEMELFIMINKYYEVLRLKNYYEQIIEFYRKTEDQRMISYFEKKLEILMEKNYLFTSNPQEYSYTLDYCLLQTARYNTNITYNPCGRILITNEFKKWYEKWFLYVSTLDNDSFSLYARYRYEGKNLDCFNIQKPLELDKKLDNIEDLNINDLYVLTKNIRHISA